MPKSAVRSNIRRLFVCTSHFAILLVFSAGSFAQDPVLKTPLLRIENGTHQAKIDRIAVDPRETYLATASEDKTLRMWDASTGKLLRTLRPPIGDADIGALWAVAISPDGQTIAVGGNTPSNQQTYVIYLFAAQTGVFLKRIRGLPMGMYDLAFSPDGRYLAVALVRGGVILIEWQHLSTAKGDGAYTQDTTRVAFVGSNKLVTTSFDGFVRLYAIGTDGTLRIIAKRAVPQGHDGFAISASPDGSKIAVGFYETGSLAVLSANDLSDIVSFDASFEWFSFTCVTWSLDGKVVFAGGRNRSGSGELLIWTLPKSFGIMAVADNTLLDLRTSSNGNIFFSSSDPALGILGADGRRKLFVRSPTIDSRRHELAISAKADAVQVWYETSPASTGFFSVSDRTLSSVRPERLDFRPPRTEAPGLSIANWHGAQSPTLNGKPLALYPRELSRSLAIAPDGQSFALGTELMVRLFESSGTQRWAAVTQTPAAFVNFSADGKLTLAQMRDGSIHWYRSSDGKELLVLLVQADQKRWILWTPSGYYDASPGAEDLIGWHINDGMDHTADFFPVGRFRSRFYRPDVIDQILVAGDEDAALRQANELAGRSGTKPVLEEMLPPVVQIVSPGDSTSFNENKLNLRYTVRSSAASPVQTVRALVDGRPSGAEIKLPPGAPGDGELSFNVPSRDVVVSIIATNGFGASVPSTIHLKWQGRANIDPSEAKPMLYVLAVGVAKYADPNLELLFAAKDAADFSDAMKPQAGLRYRDIKFQMLTDEKATKANVLAGLDWIRKQTTSQDIAMVLLSGHGVNDRTGDYFFLPFDVDLKALAKTGVSFSSITDTIAKLAGNTVIFIDTCHSGNIFRGPKAFRHDINGAVNDLTSPENGAVVFLSSTGRQLSLEAEGWKNGAFTKAVVEGIEGRADFRGEGRIRLSGLQYYVSGRVEELTNGQQSPTTAMPQAVQDLTIALSR